MLLLIPAIAIVILLYVTTRRALHVALPAAHNVVGVVKPVGSVYMCIGRIFSNDRVKAKKQICL